MSINQKEDSKILQAAERVLEVLKEVEVAYDRELRYRLESEFPHDKIGQAITKLRREGKVKQYHLPGRKGKEEAPNTFYALPGSDYRSLLPKMREKFELAVAVIDISSAMGLYAEEVWYNAFRERGWRVYPERIEEIGNVRKFRDLEATRDTKVGIDFIVEKDGIAYGVEVKNKLPYPSQLLEKIIVMVDLGLIPLIIARWLNPSQINAIKKLGGFYVVYKTAIYSPTYKELIDKAVKVLGFPIECRDKVDDEYFEKNIVKGIHERVLREEEKIRAKLEAFKKDVKRYRRWKRLLDSSS
jgi:predicted RecB family endonuclease